MQQIGFTARGLIQQVVPLPGVKKCQRLVAGRIGAELFYMKPRVKHEWYV